MAFCGGAEVSDREISETDFLTKVYYTLGLFVLGGLDLGVPSGGPTWARFALWLVYFAAPAITTSAVVEAVLRMIRPENFRLRTLRQHVVIVGCGRLAMLYLERLREVEPHRPVLIIDNRTENPFIQVASERFHASVLVGDITTEPMRRAIRLETAHRLAVLTGDNYVNLDTAASAIRRAPHLAAHTLVHISDIRLLRIVEEIDLLKPVAKFNSYRRAANYLVTEKLLPHFEKTETDDIVVLAGFGRFGQSVLDQLQQKAAGKFTKVIIVDRDGDLATMVFAEQIGFREGFEWHLLAADLEHPRTWQEVETIMGPRGNGHEPVFILGTGNDSVNIRTALWLSRKHPGTKIVARRFRQSTFADQVSEECRFEVVNVAELLLTGMLPAWFGDPN